MTKRTTAAASKQQEIGRLDAVPLTLAWPHEARDFTPWLGKNLDRLADILGFPLELTKTEFAVDEFSADIVGRNPENDTIVLIENQFTGSDHGHLGQLLTYLAGAKAQTIVWVAASFRDAHISAIRWLNENTSDEFGFYAVTVKAVRIGESPVAPIFDVVERPNTWDREVKATTKRGETPSETGQFRRAFWAHYLEQHPEDSFWGEAGGASSRWRIHPPIVVAAYLSERGVGVFYRCERGGDYSAIGDLLEPYADQLERQLGAKFNNDRYLFHKRLDLDMTNRANWEQGARWLKEQADLYGVAVEQILGDVT